MMNDRRFNPSIAALAAAIGVLLGARISQAEINRTPIAVPAIGTQGPASTYPSTIAVPSLRGKILVSAGENPTTLRGVTLFAVTHPCPEELAILLVHNDVDKVLLMSHAGGCRPLQGTALEFIVTENLALLDDDPPPTPAHGARLIISPSNYGTPPIFPAPAPAGPYATTLPFRQSTVGTWSLYVLDTGGAGRGVIAGGWSLNYRPNIVSTSKTLVPVPGNGPAPGAATLYPIGLGLEDVSPTHEAEHAHMQCTVALKHERPSDLVIVLQSPAGKAVLLMAGAGGNTPFDGTLTFRESDSSPLPSVPINAPLVSGAYSPGGAQGVTAIPGADAPSAPFASSFNVFDRQPIAGTWKLWVFDRVRATSSGEIGTVSLTFELEPFLSFTATPGQLKGTSDRPFSLVEANTFGPDTGGGPSAALATWRVLNSGVFYAAGVFDFREAQSAFGLQDPRNVIFADVPVKRGLNTIEVIEATAYGTQAIHSVERTVEEFTYALAEGATGQFFDLDITLSNPAGTSAPVRVDFLPEGRAPIAIQRRIDAGTSLQLHVDDTLPDAALSTVIHSIDAIPLAVERTMSWDERGYGGHGGGAISPARRWLFAEGAQGFFNTFVLLANDNAAAVDATVTFLLEGGGTVERIVNVPAHARRTLFAGDIAQVVDRSFGLDITATAPIIAERAMYFSMGTTRLFDGGHESAGVNDASRRWFLAEGATGPFFDCFILLSNPSSDDASVTLTYLLPSGETIPQTLTVGPHSRQTINVETVDTRLANAAVSTAVSSNVPIVVERAMYWPNIAQGWQEAHNSFGVTETALRWGVADGRLGGPRGHDTYILLANPNPLPAEVEVRFLKAGARTPVVRTYTLPPTSRLNIQASQDAPQLGEGVFGADIQVLNFQPIAVEKAMYWNADGVVWAAGTNVTATRLPPP